MADVNLSTIIGAGGDFIPRETSGNQSIAASTSGDLATLTPPSGQRVRLNGLIAATATNETGITVLVGSTEVINSKAITNSADNATNSLFILNGSPTSVQANCVPPLLGKVDEVIKIQKDTGSTANILFYSFQFGE